MCGLAGFLSVSGQLAHNEWESTLRKMGDAIHHRGPDDSGVWVEPDSGIGMVHQRLSILDLSPAGHQPMQANSGRFALVFNGEIYNHLEIRDELASLRGGSEPLKWRGHSDTETLLAGFDAWGILETLKKSVGMFAIAVWDKQTRELTLARDRLGEKPLYYGWQGNTLFFASELKALKPHPNFQATIDRDALGLLVRHNYIPAPHSIYQNIKKLIPGTYITVSQQNKNPDPVYYWNPGRMMSQGLENPFQGDSQDAVDALDKTLRNAISQQMIADVPLGAFLSGGIDSTTVVALMQAQSSKPVKTFTIGFNEKGYNEAVHAKAVAQHLGTDHTELYITSEQARDVIPKLPSIYCEPFSDSSQIPTYLVSHLAREHVTVSLSGDGGDELFGGYSRYFKAVGLSQKLLKIPAPFKGVLPPLLRSLSPSAWDRVFATTAPLMNKFVNTGDIGAKIHLIADAMKEHGPQSQLALYRYMTSHWKKTDELVLGSTDLQTVFTDVSRRPQMQDYFNQMMAIDLQSYLPDDILTKVGQGIHVCQSGITGSSA